MLYEVNNIIKWGVARIVCVPALCMPYRVRIRYISVLSNITHTPFYVFGTLAGFLMKRLNLTFPAPPAKATSPEVEQKLKSSEKDPQQPLPSVAILYSGGTDSTCVAALMAKKCGEIHLLTFYERATRNSPFPKENIRLLKAKFPKTNFVTKLISVDRLVKHFWYENYLKRLRNNGFLTLSTCGFSTLSWHVQTIVYCLENKITYVTDGLTQELLHFPGHMDLVVEEFKDLYEKFGIVYENPVRNFPVPDNQQFVDKLLVNRHGITNPLEYSSVTTQKTTGQYLYSIGLFPDKNLKGTKRDFRMQHDCYPFALYNILAFWGYLSIEPYEVFSGKVYTIMKSKIDHATELLQRYAENSDQSRLHELLQS